MKTSLPPIPEKRLKEIEFITSAIKSEFEKKDIEIEKIILFGSYARGDFVEKDVHQVGHHKEVYRSDFDIMIITKKDLLEEAGGLSVYVTDIIYKRNKVETPLTLIIEDLGHVNTMLNMGRYFYSDIKKEGVVLFDNSGVELAEYKVLTPKERLAMMREDYKIWFPQGNSFFKTYKFNLGENDLNISAFQLHQATESYITAYLLVKTSYKERTHDLGVLYNDLMMNDREFGGWFNFEDREEYRLFNLLRDAYVRARYDKDYEITKEELEFLGKKVEVLRGLVERICGEEIGLF